MNIAGVLSILLLTEYWLHMLVPFLRHNLLFPPWPVGAAAELVISALLGVFAAASGSRAWWATVGCAIASLALMLFMFSG